MKKKFIIPPDRTRYLSEISESNRAYNKWVDQQSKIANKLFNISSTIEIVKESTNDKDSLNSLNQLKDDISLDLTPRNLEIIKSWSDKVKAYKNPIYKFKVRDKEISINTTTESLSGNHIPKVSLPKYNAWGDILKWSLQENVPGEYPYTAGLFLLKELAKIQQECLLVREVQREQINVFIMFH